MSFATFPEFTVLTYEHRQEYERLIESYPPIADISFAGLMGWWGIVRPPGISLLNGNLIIAYHSQFGEDAIDFCILGINKIDETICLIHEYLIEQGVKPKLSHVPDFVVDNIRYPELFNFKAERDFDEYLIDLSRQQPLENISGFQRYRVEQFIERMQGHHVIVEPLDLRDQTVRDELLRLISLWPKRGINSANPHEMMAIKRAIANADKLGLKTAGLKIDNVMHGFILFDAPHNEEYMTLEYARLSYDINHIANFAIFMFSEWLAAQGVKYANVSMDYGKPVLRIAKLALRPANFFRKYSIEPQKQAITAGRNISY